jgi:hypothetical protein
MRCCDRKRSCHCTEGDFRDRLRQPSIRMASLPHRLEDSRIRTPAMPNTVLHARLVAVREGVNMVARLQAQRRRAEVHVKSAAAVGGVGCERRVRYRRQAPVRRIPPRRWSASQLPGRPDLIVRRKLPQPGSTAIMATAGVSSATETTSAVLPLSGWPAGRLAGLWTVSTKSRAPASAAKTCARAAHERRCCGMISPASYG